MADQNLICDIGECDHSPLNPPRASHHGEQVFAERWADMMTQQAAFDDESNAMLRSILKISPVEMTQRLATVSASFVTWLGTSCGRAFIESAGRFESQDSYLMAWAIENRRQSWVNSGYRAIEHILTPDSDRINGQLAFRPELSADDYEAVESIVIWLGSDDGKRFVDECRKEISERHLAEGVALAVGRRDFKHAKLLLDSNSKTKGLL